MTAKAARRRLPPAERRAMILDEALRLFAERHYSVVTVRDIAQTCEMNVGLLYHYFDSKDDLVRQALEHAIGQLMLGYEERRTEQADPLAEILAWLEIHIEIAPTLARMVKLMADYASSRLRDDELDALIAGFYRGEKEVLESALSRGIAGGLFRPHDIGLMARRIGLMLDGIFFASASRGDNRIEADIRDLADTLPAWIGAEAAAAPAHSAS